MTSTGRTPCLAGGRSWPPPTTIARRFFARRLVLTPSVASLHRYAKPLSRLRRRRRRELHVPVRGRRGSEPAVLKVMARDEVPDSTREDARQGRDQSFRSQAAAQVRVRIRTCTISPQSFVELNASHPLVAPARRCRGVHHAFQKERFEMSRRFIVPHQAHLPGRPRRQGMAWPSEATLLGSREAPGRDNTRGAGDDAELVHPVRGSTAQRDGQHGACRTHSLTGTSN